MNAAFAPPQEAPLSSSPPSESTFPARVFSRLSQYYSFDEEREQGTCPFQVDVCMFPPPPQSLAIDLHDPSGPPELSSIATPEDFTLAFDPSEYALASQQLS
jgi:hypothetical protein